MARKDELGEKTMEAYEENENMVADSEWIQGEEKNTYLNRDYGENKRFESDCDPLLITIEEARKCLNLGRNTMLKLAKVKGFPALYFKRKILIDKNELPNWFRKNYGQWRS